MGNTSTASKRKYNEKAYERLSITVKVGKKTFIQKRADDLGLSVNGYISYLIENDMKGGASNGNERSIN